MISPDALVTELEPPADEAAFNPWEEDSDEVDAFRLPAVMQPRADAVLLLQSLLFGAGRREKLVLFARHNFTAIHAMDGDDER